MKKATATDLLVLMELILSYRDTALMEHWNEDHITRNILLASDNAVKKARNEEASKCKK